jgi:1-acyl-sn-glycerol-3-phosphate acyltransferase
VNRLRFGLRTLAIALGLVVCLLPHWAWRVAGARSPWPRRFLKWVGFAAGVRVRAEGTPLQAKVLFLANHASWLDIMLLAGASGAAFVSKAEVRDWPVVGWLAGLNRTVYVERAKRGDVRGQADALRDALAAGQPVALFPEGTTEGGCAVLPFRASLLASVFPPLPGVRVQPVAIDYGDAAGDIAWIGDEAAGANVRRILSRPGTIPVVIRFLAPLDPAAAGDRKALAAAAQAEVEAALHRPASSAAPAPLYGRDEE